MLILLLCLSLVGEVKLDSGLSLYYISEGGGEPLLLLNGLGGTVAGWQATSDLLAKKFTVIRLDHRGMGKSGDLEGAYTVQTMADDAAQVMNKLGYERYHVAGMSLGSFAAQTLTLSYPKRVKRLVLIGSSAGGPTHVIPDGEVMTFFQTMATMTAEERTRKGLTLSLDPAFLSANPEFVTTYVSHSLAHPSSPAVVQRQFFAGLGFNNSELAKDIASPTLVLHGVGDRIVPTQNGRNLAKLIANSKLVILENSGHVSIMDAADKTAAAMISFLSP